MNNIFKFIVISMFCCKQLFADVVAVNNNQIKELGELLGIKPKTIIKEKIVEKIVYKERKAKINNYDDY